MRYKTLLLDIIENNISILTLNNRENYNCLSQIFFDEFEDAIEKINNNNNIRALIIRGTEGVFSSGGNLKEIKESDYNMANAMAIRCQNAFQSLMFLNIPVIAMIDGITIGGGFELALHCDFRFVSPKSVFRLPEINFGILPAAGGISIFSRLFNSADALFYLLTAKDIPIEKLLNCGIIQKIFSEKNIYNETIDFVKSIIQKPKESIAVIKKNYYRCFFEDINTCLKFDALEFSSLLQKIGKEKINNFYNSKK